MALSTKLTLCSLLLMISCSLPLWAGNSIFAFQGLPYQYYGNDIYGLSMGDTGMSDTYRLNTGFGNPALIALTKNAVFSTGIMMGYTNYRDTDGHSFRDNSLDFPYFNIVVPIANHKIGMQFHSLSSGVVSDQRTVTPADSNQITYTEYNSADSYLYRVDFMYSYPYKYLDFGIAMNYYLGHETRSISQDSGNSPFNTYYSLHKQYDNIGFSVGLLKRTSAFSASVTYTSATKLSGDMQYKSIQTTTDMGTAYYSLPNRIGAGLTLYHSERIRTAFEGHYDMWKAADNPENTEDSWKVGVGVAYETNANSDKWMKKVPIRAGFSMRRLPFLKNGNTIDEKVISAGFTLPLKNPENRLDLGCMYTLRGDKDNHLVEENSIMILLGITGFDIFSREHRRTAPRDIPKVEELR